MIDRYTRPAMGRIWTLENKFATWLKIEVLACEAWGQLGVIPADSLERIRSRVRIDVERILELEETLNHDVIAFTTSLAEQVGEDARYIHYGLTSSDVVDTALSALLVEALELIVGGLEDLAAELAALAKKYKHTPMIGRTHGVHAEPTTFGLKVALWYEETRRNLERVSRARDTIACGKISGAVGTYSSVPPFVEQYVCERMGLKASPVSSQIIQRDRHAEVATALAITASSLDKFATEIRALQKTEVREVEEPFGRGQKGSSAMPHKRNPIICERISGLSRVVRANALVALENVPLWHERDISHSSAERIILPDSTILLDYMIHRFIGVIRGLKVYPENMLRNLNLTGGMIYSQSVLLSLVKRGMSREDAYAIVQGAAMEAWQGGPTFKERILTNSQVLALIERDELETLFEIGNRLDAVDEIFARIGL